MLLLWLPMPRCDRLCCATALAMALLCQWLVLVVVVPFVPID